MGASAPSAAHFTDRRATHNPSCRTFRAIPADGQSSAVTLHYWSLLTKSAPKSFGRSQIRRVPQIHPIQVRSA